MRIKDWNCIKYYQSKLGFKVSLKDTFKTLHDKKLKSRNNIISVDFTKKIKKSLS